MFFIRSSSPLWGIWIMYLLLLASPSISRKSYALSRHTHILFTWRSLNYYTIQRIFCSLHVTRICRHNDNNNRHTMECHVGLSISIWHLIPISPLSMEFGPTYHVPPKDALQIHYQAIAISIQCLWGHHKLTSNSLILFRKYVNTVHPLLKPPMAGSRTRSIFSWKHFPLASCS